MKRLNEVYYRVIELENKERCVVVPSILHASKVAKTKNLIIEDFYNNEQVRLFSLSSIESEPQFVKVDYAPYKLKKANPDEQQAIAEIKRFINQIIAKRKIEHRQLLQKQELEVQIKQLEDKLAGVEQESRLVNQEVQQLLDQRRQVVTDYIIGQRFKNPKRDLIHYNFYDSKTGNSDEATATYLVKYTDKPIYIRHGFAYRGAKLNPTTREDALNSIKNNWADIVEHVDRVEINTYSGNDMW